MTEQQKGLVPIVNGVIQPVDFDGMWKIANIYAGSGLVPKQFTGNPAGIIVAGQFGAELGLSLMPSLQNIAVINGNPTLWGDAMLAVVENSQTLERFVEYYEGKPGTDEYTAVCIAKRKGKGDDYNPADDLDTMRKKGLFVNDYSMADAKRADLLAKDNWKKNPRRMLKMRARSFTLRDGWPDKLKGMRSMEEMIDATDVINVTASSSRIEDIHVKTDVEWAADFDAASQNLDMDDWLMIGAKQKGVSLEAMKAEIAKAGEVAECVAAYRKHLEAQDAKAKVEAKAKEEAPKGQPENDQDQEEAVPWYPMKADVQQRYRDNQKQALRELAMARKMPFDGKDYPGLHKQLLADAQGITPQNVTGMAGPASSENKGAFTPGAPGVYEGTITDPVYLQNIEKYNQARAMPKFGAAVAHADRKMGVKPSNPSSVITWLNYFETFAKTILGKPVDWDGPNQPADAIDLDGPPDFGEDEKM